MKIVRSTINEMKISRDGYYIKTISLPGIPSFIKTKEDALEYFKDKSPFEKYDAAMRFDIPYFLKEAIDSGFVKPNFNRNQPIKDAVHIGSKKMIEMMLLNYPEVKDRLTKEMIEKIKSLGINNVHFKNDERLDDYDS